MKVRRPWFKFWPGTWLSARSVTLMTPAQKGVYIDLLCLSWQEGFIPADPDELAFLLRLPREEFLPIWDRVKTHFKSVKNSPKKLVNHRLEDERSKAQERSDKTRKAAQERWDKADANAEQTHSKRNAVQKKREEEEEEEDKKKESAFDFEAVYNAYPGSGTKAKGIDHLKREVKSRALYDRVLAAAKRYAAEEHAFKASGSKAFRPGVPNFSTWCNQRRWEDFDDKPTTAKSAAQLLAEESKRQRQAEFEGMP